MSRAALTLCLVATALAVADAATRTLPSRLPRFSWDTVPVYIHMCNRTGAFSDDAIDFISQFDIVTIEKGQGEDESECCAEDKILAAAKQVKAKDPGIHVVYYINSVLDWEFYRLHQLMLQEPQHWMRNSSGLPVLLHGDSSFPQPKPGMLVFNFTDQGGRDFWASSCINMTKTGYIDGCFSDRSQNMSFPGVSGQVMADYNEGHYEVLASLQTQIPGVLIANNDPDSRIEGYMIEGYRNDAASLHLLLDAVRQGRIVEVHAGYYGAEHDSNCTNIENTLASFLIGAGQYSYYGCSTGWYIDTWYHWNPEYSKPLGAPLGSATKSGNVWSRRFSSGTNVTFNEHNGRGQIYWAS